MTSCAGMSLCCISKTATTGPRARKVAEIRNTRGSRWVMFRLKIAIFGRALIVLFPGSGGSQLRTGDHDRLNRARHRHCRIRRELVDELPVPELESDAAIDQPAAIGGPGLMLLPVELQRSPLHQLALDEGAREQYIVKLGAVGHLAQPAGKGRRIAELAAAPGDTVGQDRLRRLAQHPFRPAIADLVCRIETECEFDDAMVEIRDPRLDREGHGVAVFVVQEGRYLL